MSSPRFRVRILEPACTVWSAPISAIEALIVQRAHRGSGLRSDLIENTRPRHCQVEALFAAAHPRDRGWMTVAGVTCGYVRVPRPSGELVTSKAQLAAVLDVPAATVIEVPTVPPSLLAKAVAFARAVLGIPRGKERP